MSRVSKDFSNENGIGKLADPESFGPGAWLVIHSIAFRAKTDEEKRSFIRTMKQICDGLKCQTCKQHCIAYIKEHPIIKYWNIKNKEGEDIGMFKWTWAFHNAVSSRLRKPTMDFESAYHLYSDLPDTICTKECGTTETKTDHNGKKNKVISYVSSSSVTYSPKDLVNNNPLVSSSSTTYKKHKSYAKIKPYRYKRR